MNSQHLKAEIMHPAVSFDPDLDKDVLMKNPITRLCCIFAPFLLCIYNIKQYSTNEKLFKIKFSLYMQ